MGKPVPGLPLRHLSHGLRQPDGAVSVHRAGSVADQQAARSSRSASTSARKGPKSHQKKAGTPTMGGVLIIISIVVPTLLWADLRYPYVWIALAALVGFGWIGFLDDYAKITQQRNLGLTRPAQAGLPVLAGLRLRRRAAVHARVRRVLHHHEHPVHQAVPALAAVRIAAGEPLDCTCWARRPSAFSWRWWWCSCRTPST